MLERIPVEEIYDASTDDECFDQLSVRLAQMLGARSGVVHWRRADDPAAEHEVSYSGYFSTDDMAEYDRHFTGQDLWSNAVQSCGRVNVAFDCEELVPSETYENSPLYNDWIRRMGDDSFFAVGAALRRGPIVAEMGFHRGKSQGRFNPRSIDLLNEYVGHITRCLTIREQLKTAKAHEEAASAGLDAIGYGVFTLSAAGHLLHHNLAAERLLESGDPFKLLGGKLCATGPADPGSLTDAVEAAASSQGARPVALKIHREDRAAFEVSVLSAATPTGRHVMVLVRDPAHRDSSLVDRLRTLFGLTLAEAEIAVRLADGCSAKTLSDERRTGLETVRSQIKAAAAKLGCQRQAEIVAVVRNLPPLMSRGEDAPIR